METVTDYVSAASELGFTKAAANAVADYALAKKLLVAYASYEVVTRTQVEKFQAELREKTEVKMNDYFQTKKFKALKFEAIGEYASMPPAEVLQMVREAKATGLFSGFEVAYIVDAEERRDPDPIIFGTIEGCSDHFFIAQWGDDVKISDLVAVQP